MNRTYAFYTTIVLSLGIAGPLLRAMDFADSLAKMGTIVSSVDAVLHGKEQNHGNTPVRFPGGTFEPSHVSFGHYTGKEVLDGIGLMIHAGSMTSSAPCRMANGTPTAHHSPH